MDNDISGIERMAGVTTNQLNNEFYQSEASGDPHSQFTPYDLDKFIELESDETEKKKGGNFSQTEDLVLVSAWLNVSLDPITSTKQKAEKYWQRICKYYNETIDNKYGPRNVKSLQCRWGKIQRGVNKFCGYYSQLEMSRKSGVTNHDLITEAKLTYHSKEKGEFPYEHCWNKLRFECKWINLGSQGPVKKRAHLSDTINLDDEENPTADFVDLDRPPGGRKQKDDDERQGQEKGKGKEKRLRKANDTSLFDVSFSNYMEEKRKDDEVKMDMAKQHMEMEKQKVEMEKMKLNIEMMRVEADKEKIAAKREKEEQAIMMMNLSNMETEMQRQYFSKLQANVFARSMSK